MESVGVVGTGMVDGLQYLRCRDPRGINRKPTNMGATQVNPSRRQVTLVISHPHSPGNRSSERPAFLLFHNVVRDGRRYPILERPDSLRAKRSEVAARRWGEDGIRTGLFLPRKTPTRVQGAQY